DLQPGHPWVLLDLCGFTARLGAMAEARTYEAQLATAGRPPYQDFPRMCAFEIAAASGQTSRLHALADGITGRIMRSHPTDIGVYYSRAGDPANAMARFSTAYDERDARLIWFLYDAGTPKNLLDDAQWKALWRRPLLADWRRRHDRIAAELALG